MALIVCLFSSMALAQGVQSGHHPSPTRYTVNFESRGGEAFTVYVDGTLVNRMPQTRVMVDDLGNQTHEVVVVLVRPVQKAAILLLCPNEPSVMVNVTYDPQTDALSLYTPSHNRAEREIPTLADMEKPALKLHKLPGKPQAKVQSHPRKGPVQEVSDEEVDGMVTRMRAQSFDSDRLALGKVIVASADLTALQIARLAETLDYSASQVDFLKYAYQYCADPVNYYKTTNVLTFSSDKKRVLDHIASQK